MNIKGGKMSIRDLMKSTWKEIDELNKSKTLIIAPIASIEQHGLHLPVSTDYLIMQAIIEHLLEEEIVEMEYLILPIIQFGLNTEHKKFPGTISFKPDTIISVIKEELLSFWQHGFRDFAFLNTHGGNIEILQLFIREFKTEYPCNVAYFDYFAEEFFKEKLGLFENKIGLDIHAGEFETSLLLYLFPDLVSMENKKEQDLNVCINDLPVGWLTSELSMSGVIGNATFASAQKGKELFNYLISKLIRQLSNYRFSNKNI